MYIQKFMSRWQSFTQIAALSALMAVLAAVVLQHGPSLQQGERISAATTHAADVELAATNKCIETGTISRNSIESAFGGRQIGSAASLYAGVDFDSSADNLVTYNAKANAVSIVAQADGDCATHGRRLGGMSPWLGGAIAAGCGLTTRLGSLAILLFSGVPVTIAKPTSDFLGGFVAGVVGNYLISGKFTARSVAAGLFGGMTSALGGYASARIISAMRNLPRQAAAAARNLNPGVGTAVQQAGGYMADALGAAQPEWDAIINDFLRTHP